MLELLLQNTDFVLVGCDLLLFLFYGYAALFQIGNDILEGLVFLANLFSGCIDNILRQTKLGGDGKGITLTRNTDEQSVGGLQSFHTELTAGIFHERSGKSINL